MQLGEFAWKGQVVKGLGAVPWRLVKHLWHEEHHTADFMELADPVWSDREREVTADMVGSARREVNRWFLKDAEAPIPITISISRTTVILTVPEE